MTEAAKVGESGSAGAVNLSAAIPPAATHEPAAPWWSSKVLVATVTATLAAILPLVTFVQTTVKEAAEERARARQQQDTVRLAYLAKAIDPAHPATLRLSVLRFLARSSQVDDDIKQWAIEEQPAVKQLVEAQARTDEAQVRSEAAQLNAARNRVAELQKEKAPSEAVIVQLKGAEEQAARLSERISETETRLRAAQQFTAPVAPRPCSNPRMRSDLRSGIDERAGSDACQAASKSRRAGETWLERRDGKAFECSCDA